MMKKAWVIVGLVFVVLMAGCAEPEVTEVKTPTATPTSTHTLVTPTPTATPTPAQRGTLNNPATIGETVVVKSAGNTFEITVLDVVRGEKANTVIKQANMFNPDPDQGFEYLLVKVRFAYADGKQAQYSSDYDFKAYCEGTGYSPVIVVMPDQYPKFKTVNLLPGGKNEGWIVFTVPKDKEVLIAYEYLFEPVCFISVGT